MIVTSVRCGLSGIVFRGKAGYGGAAAVATLESVEDMDGVICLSTEFAWSGFGIQLGTPLTDRIYQRRLQAQANKGSHVIRVLLEYTTLPSIISDIT